MLAEPEDHALARRVFGDRIAPLDRKRNPAYIVQGGLRSAVVRAAPGAEVLFVTQEFGTLGPLAALHALREENRWAHFGEGTVDHPAKRALKAAFFPDDETWRTRVLKRGAELIQQALEEV
mgnify:CR=1 FL=1